MDKNADETVVMLNKSCEDDTMVTTQLYEGFEWLENGEMWAGNPLWFLIDQSNGWKCWHN